MVIFDSFSGDAAGLPRGKRTAEHVLAALRRDPRVSTFDMSEYRWLRSAIDQLRTEGRIKVLESSYPWCRFAVIDGPANRANTGDQQ